MKLDLPVIPTPVNKRIACQINPNAARAIRKGHPWLYDSSIKKQNKSGAPGDLAVLFDGKRQFVAIGLYDPYSPIRVKILSLDNPTVIDEAWFQKVIWEAWQARKGLPTNTTGYRLVHGENDGLPGLVVDRYAHTLVMKLYTLVWLPYLQQIINTLINIESIERIVLRISRGVEKHSQQIYGLENGAILYGPDITSQLFFEENGLTFEVDPLHGQKTGFYLDQRDNRSRVEKLANKKNILNVFAYTGGFSLYAARGGAVSITSIDLSQPALDSAVRNFSHNKVNSNVRLARHNVIQGDAFKVLLDLSHEKKQYDVVIIDPPGFANKRKHKEKALSAYKQLNHLGLNLLRTGGILIQSSCSSQIDESTFFSMLHNSAKRHGRNMTEIERTGHAIDHPVRFDQGAYLKTLFASIY
jgi:23S rRNA (cytosine1962-C5)-methyltransferase